MQAVDLDTLAEQVLVQGLRGRFHAFFHVSAGNDYERRGIVNVAQGTRHGFDFGGRRVVRIRSRTHLVVSADGGNASADIRRNT